LNSKKELFTALLTIHPDKKVYQRRVFTYFDFLSEIGGLIGILSQLAQLLINIISVVSPLNSLNRSLTKKIFWIDNKAPASDRGKHPVDRLMKWRRASIRGVLCYFCRGKKSKMILDNGANSLQREFDVVKFVKFMKQAKAMMHVIFTRRERALLRYNHHLLLRP
jgi:hypothetical protein